MRLDDERAHFVLSNAELFEVELARHKKRFVFERRRLEQRIARSEERIDALRTYRDPESRRTVAGHRATVTRAQREIHELADRQREDRQRLDKLSKPTVSMRVVGVARLLGVATSGGG